MMSAIETAQARLAKEAEDLEKRAFEAQAAPQPPTPLPTTLPTTLPTPTRTAVPHSSTSAARYSVSLTLDPHVHQYFAEAAEKDERTLAKYLARVLRQIVDEENALARKIEEKKKQDANF